MTRTTSSLAPTLIRPPGWLGGLDVAELWAYRELLYFLVWRDIKVRYKQTVIGVGWALIQPFGTMVVFSLFFGGLARMPSDGLPYPIFFYAALEESRSVAKSQFSRALVLLCCLIPSLSFWTSGIGKDSLAFFPLDPVLANVVHGAVMADTSQRGIRIEATPGSISARLTVDQLSGTDDRELEVNGIGADLYFAFRRP